MLPGIPIVHVTTFLTGKEALILGDLMHYLPFGKHTYDEATLISGSWRLCAADLARECFGVEYGVGSTRCTALVVWSAQLLPVHIASESRRTLDMSCS